MIEHAKTNANKFQAGNLTNCLTFWRKITSDINILTCITGLKIEFQHCPGQIYAPSPYKVDMIKHAKISVQINEMLSQGVLELCTPVMSVSFKHLYQR